MTRLNQSTYRLAMIGCKFIRKTTNLLEAESHSRQAFGIIIFALMDEKISYEMCKLLIRKIDAAMVEGGFRDSGKSRAFAFISSKRYTHTFF